MAHDEEALELVSVTTEGNTAGDLSFRVLTCGPVTEECTSRIQTCGEDLACGSDGRRDGGVWLSATLFDFGWMRRQLPLNRNGLARATYRLRKDVGEAGTLIRFSDRLAFEGSPPANLFLTVDGASKLWSTAVEGWVRKVAASGSFSRGDLDSSGRIDILDAVLSIQAFFGGGATPTATTPSMPTTTGISASRTPSRSSNTSSGRDRRSHRLSEVAASTARATRSSASSRTVPESAGPGSHSP